MDNYFDLGHYSWPITTRSPEAQIWFDRGMIWCYGFHRTEALRCFQKVVEADPDCAMGYWGLAYAISPCYNISWLQMPQSVRVKGLVQTYEHARQAKCLAAQGTPIEQALCHAFTVRYAAPQVEDDDLFTQWDDVYAQAMREVYAQFPNNYDVCALTSEALMCRPPWQLWDLENRVPAEGSDTAEAVTILETAMKRTIELGDTPHLGLLHFYIHCMEMSPEPERALVASDTRQPLVLEQGHVAEATQVYRADLGLDDALVRPSQPPGNVWSLHGYAECCRRLGHADEASAIEVQLERAQAVTDVTINTSCFCRQVDDCCE